MTTYRRIQEKIENSHYSIYPILAIIITIIQVGFLIWRYSSWYYDDPFITYRYAQHLIRGVGFVYNSGERVLSTTTPLFTLLLACLGFIWSDLPRLATIIGCVCTGLSGLIFWDLARKWNMDFASWVGLLLIPVFPLIDSTISSETPLYIALVLGTLNCYIRGHYRWTAIFAALLILVRPDGILLALIIAIDFLLKKKKPIPWVALGIFTFINTLWFSFAWLYFGSPLPVTLQAKHQQGVMSISQLFAPGVLRIASAYAHSNYLIEAILALIGAIWLLFRRHPSLILVFWTLSYFLAYTLLGVTRYFWYYAPLVPGFITMVCAGSQYIYELVTQFHWQRIKKFHLERFLYICLIVLWIFQGIDSYNNSQNRDERYFVYKSIGEWLKNNTIESDRVGTLETGIIGYYAENPIVDFAGLLQPDVAKQMRAESTYEDMALWAINAYHPSYIVLNPKGIPILLKDYLNNQCRIVQEFSKEENSFTQDMAIYHCEDGS